MALTARFVADFASFYDAVTKAEVSLKSFETGAGNVEKQLNKMGNSFSGTKIIQDAHLMTAAMVQAGGMTTLTDKEMRKLGATVGEASEKMRKLGIEVPPGFQRISAAADKIGVSAKSSTTLLAGMSAQLAGMFTIGAVVAFGREILRMGDDIVRVADRTGLLTDEVQQLSFIAKQSGNSLDELVGAIGQMQNRLASGDKSAVGAVKALNISFDELRKAGPYQQLQLIADAVGKIPDPAGRAQVAMDLFGRTGIAILPTLQSEFSKLGDAAPKMAHNTVVALDQAGDALDKFQLSMKVWAAESYNLLGNFFDKFTSLTLKTTASLLDISANLLEVTLKIPGAAKVFPELAKGIQDVRDRATFARDAAKQLTTMTVDMGTQVRKATPLFTALSESATGTGKALTTTGKAATKVGDDFALLYLGNLKAVEGFRQLQVASGAAQRAMISHPMLELISRDFSGVATSVQLASTSMLTFGKSSTTALTDTLSIGDQLKDSLSKIPSILQAAFTGGGGLSGAMKAIGVMLADSITAPILKGLSDVQKRAVSAGTAAAVGLGGSAAGGMGATVAGIASGLGGAALAASHWGVAMGTAGAAGSLALGVATLGIGAAAVGVVLLIKHWKEHKKMVEENEKAITSFQQSILSTLNASQVTEAQGRQWAGTLIGVRDAYLATGRTAADAARDVKAMWDSTTKGAAEAQAAMDRINQAFIIQKQSTEALDKAIQKYGFSLEELGPAFARQELDKKAQELFQDYQVLNSAGIDHAAILNKMAGGANEYLKSALKMGLEVPEAMRPMLEAMAKQGLLTDASGNKIEDLEKAGVSFALTMSEGFKSLIAVVQKLTDAISRGLGLAIENLPDIDINTNVHPNVREEARNDGFDTDGAATGGMVTATGIQHFAKGGRVLPFPRRGTDTVPAMLTPGEMVLNAGQQKAVGRMLQMGPRGGQSQPITIILEQDARATAEWLITELPGAKVRLGVR